MSKANPYAEYYLAPWQQGRPDGVPILHAGGQVIYWKEPIVMEPPTGGVKAIPVIEVPGKGVVSGQPAKDVPPAPAPTSGSSAAGFDPIAWAKENPLLLAGLAAGAFFLFKGK
jgi:hypothetical protein